MVGYRLDTAEPSGHFPRRRCEPLLQRRWSTNRPRATAISSLGCR